MRGGANEDMEADADGEGASGMVMSCPFHMTVVDPEVSPRDSRRPETTLAPLSRLESLFSFLAMLFVRDRLPRLEPLRVITLRILLQALLSFDRFFFKSAASRLLWCSSHIIESA